MTEQTRQTLLAAYRKMVRTAEEMGPCSEAREDLLAWGEVRGYLRAQVERLEACEVTA